MGIDSLSLLEDFLRKSSLPRSRNTWQPKLGHLWSQRGGLLRFKFRDVHTVEGPRGERYGVALRDLD